MKKMFLTIITLAILISCTPVYAAEAKNSNATAAADVLYSLGLFWGTGKDAMGNPNYDLNRSPTREEAVTLLVRLLGKEKQAKSTTYDIPFNDVSTWARPYVGYAYANGLTTGTSKRTFSGSSPATATQYLTFILRALGYESGSDFQWVEASVLADEIGLTDGDYQNTTQFTRGDVVIISERALSLKLKNSDKSLAEQLMSEGAFSEQKANVIGHYSHKWDNGVVIKAATCDSQGITMTKCKECGFEKFTAIPSLGHLFDSSYVCSRCGIKNIPTLTMSNTDRSYASSVGYISNRSIQHDDATGTFTLLFSLLDHNENEIAAPALVDIYIKNASGEIVYKAIKSVATSDFCTWTTGYGRSFRAVGIEINDSEIKAGSSDSGTIYFTVYNNDYFSFDETALSIYYDLPKKDLADECSLQLPSTPQTIYYYSISGKLNTSTEVTGINYKFEEAYDGKVKLTIYFSGYKRFDIQGEKYSRACQIGWKLYDAEGYVVEDGVNYTPKLCELEKYRNSESIVYNLEPGRYRLEILDVK